ncbi:MAG: hypothetical protein EXQ89_03200 [Rhodospirillaceae bacterium]|nr:hypothetical protein [Rhodospirillaceae bacterium]
MAMTAGSGIAIIIEIFDPAGVERDWPMPGPRAEKTEPELEASLLDWDGRVAAAHAAVAALRGQFLDQFAADLARLKTMIAEGGAESGQTAWEPIRRLSHDLKGQGEVFGFAIISMIAESLHAYLGRAWTGSRPISRRLMRFSKAT